MIRKKTYLSAMQMFIMKLIILHFTLLECLHEHDVTVSRVILRKCSNRFDNFYLSCEYKSFYGNQFIFYFYSIFIDKMPGVHQVH